MDPALATSGEDMVPAPRGSQSPADAGSTAEVQALHCLSLQCSNCPRQSGAGPHAVAWCLKLAQGGALRCMEQSR